MKGKKKSNQFKLILLSLHKLNFKNKTGIFFFLILFYIITKLNIIYQGTKKNYNNPHWQKNFYFFKDQRHLPTKLKSFPSPIILKCNLNHYIYCKNAVINCWEWVIIIIYQFLFLLFTILVLMMHEVIRIAKRCQGRRTSLVYVCIPSICH